MFSITKYSINALIRQNAIAKSAISNNYSTLFFKSLQQYNNNYNLILNNKFSVRKSYNKSRYHYLDKKKGEEVEKNYEPDYRMIADIANSIDTAITPEQQEYVNSIKKKYKGGALSKRSLYRDVPHPDEVQGEGNFMPRIADNAEKLIDFALSHIPPRDGPRRSRRKKRMALRWQTKREHDAIKKAQISAANLKKHQKRKRISEEIREIKAEAARLYGKEFDTTINGQYW